MAYDMIENSKNNGSSSNYKGDADVGIYDINSDDMSKIASICSNITSSLSGATITVPAKAAKYADGIIAAARLIKNVSLSLSGFKGVIIDSINAAEENDVLYGDSSWEEIGDLLNRKKYNRNDNGEVKEATKDFFLKCGCDVSDDGIVTVKNDKGEKVYEYNLSTKTLTFNGDEIKCTIYVPSNVDDYSHLNTYTYFTMSATKDDEGNQYDQYINNPTDCGVSGRDTNKIKYPEENTSPLASNAIVIQIDKNGQNEDVILKSKNNMYLTDKGKSIVPETTKFINLVAGTDLIDNHCCNIIGGDSKFGAYSLEIAAESGDLYKTVYCVNNAVCVSKDIPENAIVVDDKTVLRGNVSGDDKTQLTTEQLKKLSGKNIFFIYASGDNNQDHNQKSGFKKSCAYSESYALTGLDYICNATSSDTNINVIYYDNGAEKYDKLKTLYAEKADKYDNLTYHDDIWDSFARNAHYSHTDGNWLITELLEADTTNCNYYFYA